MAPCIVEHLCKYRRSNAMNWDQSVSLLRQRGAGMGRAVSGHVGSFLSGGRIPSPASDIPKGVENKKCGQSLVWNCRIFKISRIDLNLFFLFTQSLLRNGDQSATTSNSTVAFTPL